MFSLMKYNLNIINLKNLFSIFQFNRQIFKIQTNCKILFQIVELRIIRNMNLYTAILASRLYYYLYIFFYKSI